mmetsp:Transcript_52439/g.135319  ORF Transcript_52439/g.135319 Transcript_52439/m.135319 type:complete len:221 (+) Transcript_52439:844-1506(+)
MVDLPSSTAALSMSMSSDSLLRLTLLLPSSVSQKPSWSASSWASSMRRVIMSSIIFFTLAKGSAASFCASRARLLLCRRSPSASRKAFTLLRGLMSLSCADPVRRFWTRDVALRPCARERYLSALPATSGDERISMAFAIAWISSVRSCCFSAKDIFFSAHWAVMSLSTFSLSAFTSMVAPSCFLSMAFFSTLRSFSAVFSEASFSAFSTESVRSATIMS